MPSNHRFLARSSASLALEAAIEQEVRAIGDLLFILIGSIKGLRPHVQTVAGIFVTDHLRPAALKAGVEIAEGQRFGLHSLRSGMATWMVSIDKTNVKTAQGNMRHAGPEIMLSKYAQVVTDEMQDVQVRWFESCGLGVGQNLLAQNTGRDAIQ